ncbi:hypothetical protein NUW54_g1747 [Trametes sanguinea]|uniref:Uncharacterized protein n=1 Tax=Trametes sanguinea TaxID=158606 RepID=A0ACC1Q5G9_9APHY|nr:hypothetical protein NUW54_g1747 [Trametes sanguinea]
MATSTLLWHCQTYPNPYSIIFYNAWPSMTSPTPGALQDPAAWCIVKDFAISRVASLPDCKANLQAHLGARFSLGVWKAALDVILAAEDDDDATVHAKASLMTITMAGPPHSSNLSTPDTSTANPDPKQTKNDFMEQVNTLCQQNLCLWHLSNPQRLAESGRGG